ncbi:hypothetical protein [Pseudonocardia sp. H11422]|uniref:hypothetical protein n=1 Tax=Pseudonocardia sp. H11422 TaxID=2835866 RepID=UPI001BDDC44E|nr:hypothetical protein [Pseudonocardia sp. H11422]
MPSLYIDGAWITGSDDATAEVINPYDGSVVREVDQATGKDVGRAVIAARALVERLTAGLSPAETEGFWRTNGERFYGVRVGESGAGKGRVPSPPQREDT